MIATDLHPVAAEPACRWFHPTPDRVVTGLLVAECLLWLSERCGWFPFNHHKGWTVLITVALLGVFVILMLFWFLVAMLFRLRFQFGIRSLMVLAVVVAIPFSWLAAEMKKAREQQAAVAALRRFHCDIAYDHRQKTSPPPVLSRFLGEDFFADLYSFCTEGGDLTDADFAHFESLPALESLFLGFVPIDDDGLKHLAGLKHLRELYLGDTPVTDAGLKHLEGLTQLELLDLASTEVTPEGARRLQQALPNCEIRL